MKIISLFFSGLILFTEYNFAEIDPHYSWLWLVPIDSGYTSGYLSILLKTQGFDSWANSIISTK